MKSRSTWLILAGVLVLFALGLIAYLSYSYQMVGKKVAENRQEKSRRPSPSTESQQMAGEWVTYTNRRYGFRINYPKNWQARESQNGDGITLTIPDEDGVIFRIYGYPATTFSLDTLESNREADEKTMHPDLSVYSRRETTVDDHPAIEGVWTFTAGAGDSLRTGSLRMHIVLSIKDEAGYAIEYTAEEPIYNRFDADFSNMVNSFKLK